MPIIFLIDKFSVVIPITVCVFLNNFVVGAILYVEKSID